MSDKCELCGGGNMELIRMWAKLKILRDALKHIVGWYDFQEDYCKIGQYAREALQRAEDASDGDSEQKISTRSVRMNKSDALEMLEILSALESWGFSNKFLLPDYLHERLGDMMDKLRKEILCEMP